MTGGRLFVVTAPSGAGKTSMVRALIARLAGLRVSVSCTTRARRENEVDGEHYHFLSFEAFMRQKEAGAFLEHAEVYGNWYGTPLSELDRGRLSNQDVILEIDWQGASKVTAIYPEAISIFILPPNIEVLSQRLRSRGTDGDDIIERRLKAATEDISHAPKFKYVIVNDDFEYALYQFESIVTAERCKSQYFSLSSYKDQ